MKFNFTTEVKSVLPRFCMNCGRTDLPLEDHHIKGRKNKFHSSIFNCIRLCKPCHDKALHKDEHALVFMAKTMAFLQKRKWRLKKSDLEFITYYNKLYETIVQANNRGNPKNL